MNGTWKRMTGLLAIALAGAASAVADERTAEGAVRTASLDVRERLMTLERIHVTAEKPADPALDAPAPELARILDEIERIEQSGDDPVRE